MRPIVTDASALVDYLLHTPTGDRVEQVVRDPETDLHTPSLCDIEVCSALRRALRGGRMNETRASEALRDYLDLPLIRHGHQGLLTRILDLRDNLSAYDATYVSLAERLGAGLLTTDSLLGRAAQAHSRIRVL